MTLTKTLRRFFSKSISLSLVKLHWAGQNKFSTDYDSFKLFKVSYQFHLVMALILFSRSYAPRYILSQCEFSYTSVYVILVVAMESVLAGGRRFSRSSLSLCARFFIQPIHESTRPKAIPCCWIINGCYSTYSVSLLVGCPYPAVRLSLSLCLARTHT